MLHFGFELFFKFDGVFVAQRLVFGGVGFYLRSVDADDAHFLKTHGVGYFENSYKKVVDLVEKALPEGGDRVMIWMASGCDVPKRYGVIRGRFDLAAREGPVGVAVKK